MSPCSRPTPYCSDCGDALIHQGNRGPHESSSAFGQYIHDHGEQDRGPWAQIFWADIDGAIYKRTTQILRIIEHKKRRDQLSLGQKTILPLLGQALTELTSKRILHPASGVFVVKSDPPFDNGGYVERIPHGAHREMSGADWVRFLTGRPVD